MKLIGFGCSFTYGSELLDPSIPVLSPKGELWDRHVQNTQYREKHVWLGQLAEKLNCNYLNLAEPACSNYAISHIFYNWLTTNDHQDCVVCVAWTSADRMSWWHDDKWVHDGFIRNEQESKFQWSFKEWLALSYDNHGIVTSQAKLFVNSVCEARQIPIIQFDALDNVNDKNKYSNYHQRGLSMKQCLKNEQKRLNRPGPPADGPPLKKTFLTNGNHPTESGHAYYVKLMTAWIRGRKILAV